MKKRVLSAFLALLTLFVFVPFGALAKDETPCFEALEFLPSAFTSGAWVAGKTFSAEVTEYDLPVKSYSTDQLTLQATTHYDAEKYEAFAEYTDIAGEKQTVPVNS
ncbi:MAG: hypothetical protein IJS65_01610, partial [Clostridia bacterium]|nr:hypothetical protein [Clostridia bacterium]